MFFPMLMPKQCSGDFNRYILTKIIKAVKKEVSVPIFLKHLRNMKIAYVPFVFFFIFRLHCVHIFENNVRRLIQNLIRKLPLSITFVMFSGFVDIKCQSSFSFWFSQVLYEYGSRSGLPPQTIATFT